MQNETTQNLFRSRLKEKIDENRFIVEDDIETTWAKIKHKIL